MSLPFPPSPYPSPPLPNVALVNWEILIYFELSNIYILTLISTSSFSEWNLYLNLPLQQSLREGFKQKPSHIFTTLDLFVYLDISHYFGLNPSLRKNNKVTVMKVLLIISYKQTYNWLSPRFSSNLNSQRMTRQENCSMFSSLWTLNRVWSIILWKRERLLQTQ